MITKIIDLILCFFIFILFISEWFLNKEERTETFQYFTFIMLFFIALNTARDKDASK